MRQELAAQERGRGKRYDGALRKRIVAFAEQRRGEGRSWMAIAKELGARFETVRRWCTALAAYGMFQSMSRTGDYWDNAVAESFLATRRAELVDHDTYVTSCGAERSFGDYIESFYNVERLHSYLDCVSLNEFELKSYVAAIAA